MQTNWDRFLDAVLVLAAFRVVWGFVGTKHARFARFARGPAAIVAYLRSGGQTVGQGRPGQ